MATSPQAETPSPPGSMWFVPPAGGQPSPLSGPFACPAYQGAQAPKAPANPRGKSLLTSPPPAPFPAPNLPKGAATTRDASQQGSRVRVTSKGASRWGEAPATPPGSPTSRMDGSFLVGSTRTDTPCGRATSPLSRSPLRAGSTGWVAGSRRNWLAQLGGNSRPTLVRWS